MSFVHRPVWLNLYGQPDPERARVRQEMRKQAVRDATAATDTVRAKLRQDIALSVQAGDDRARSSKADRPD